MIWALIEIFIPLIFAVLTGMLIGWLLWRWRRRWLSAAEWQSRLNATSAIEARLTQSENRADHLESDNRKITAASEQLRGSLQKNSEALEQCRRERTNLQAQLGLPQNRDQNTTDTAQLTATTRSDHSFSTKANKTELTLRSSPTANDISTIGNVPTLSSTTSPGNKHELNSTVAMASSHPTPNSKQGAPRDQQSSSQTLRQNGGFRDHSLARDANYGKNNLLMAKKEIQRLQARLSQSNRVSRELAAARQELFHLRSERQRYRNPPPAMQNDAQQLSQIETSTATNAKSSLGQSPTSDTTSSSEISRVRSGYRTIRATMQLSAQRSVQEKPSGDNSRIEELEAEIAHASKKSRRLDRARKHLGRFNTDYHSHFEPLNGLTSPDSKNAARPRIQTPLIEKADQKASAKHAENSSISVVELTNTVATQQRKIKLLKKRLSRCKKRSTKLQAQLTLRAYRPKKWKSGTTKFGTPGIDHVDDLQQMKGINQETENLLLHHGVQSWEQIAMLTSRQVKIIDNALSALPGKLSCKRWIKPARKILVNGHIPKSSTVHKKEATKQSK